MYFISIAYLAFFVAVVGVYFALPHRFRWVFLLAASYFYYMSWDPRYALLLLATTVIVYGAAIFMQGRPQRQKQLILVIVLTASLSVLFLFKYYNFFSSSLNDLFKKISLPYALPGLELLMPVGISFFTFQTLGYLIDIYRGTREPERNFGIFALYVSFFPVILSGPIERSTTLLPQLHQKTGFDYERVTNGLMLMAWGFFQKLVIADRLLAYANTVYGNIGVSFGEYGPITGLPLLAATIFYMFQVYCDFSGYTDIAIGTAQVMGYTLMPNFRRPFLAQSIGELWQRWHISLISWFRDYVYIPLGGNRVSRLRWYLNIIFVFTLSGLWHGAMWTFMAWGALNGAMIAIGRDTKKQRDWVRERVFAGISRIPATAYYFLFGVMTLLAVGGRAARFVGIGGMIGLLLLALGFLALGILRKREPVYMRFVDGTKHFWMIFITFLLFTVGAVFFKAHSMADAWFIFRHFMGTNVMHLFMIASPTDFLMMVALIIFLLAVHVVQERKGSIRALVRSKPLVVRWAIYYLFLMVIFATMSQTVSFEYFRF